MEEKSASGRRHEPDQREAGDGRKGAPSLGRPERRGGTQVAAGRLRDGESVRSWDGKSVLRVK